MIGRKVRLNESTFTIVGVLPAGFQPPPLSQTDSAYEMFAPLGYELNGPSSCRGCQHLRLIGRLKPWGGAGIGQRGIEYSDARSCRRTSRQI